MEIGGHVAATALDVEAIRTWVDAATAELRARAGQINALNVFPVADSDTGTNMTLTLQAGADALATDIKDGDVRTAGGALRSLATGCVVGARGNSGAILAQLMRSLANAASGAETWTAGHWRTGMTHGAREAQRAVARPVEGTILTVANAAAAAVAKHEGGFVELVTAAVLAADEALAHTTEQLPSLARAGVVDAGGLGLVVLLNTLAVAVGGSPVVLPQRDRAARPHAMLEAEREAGSADFAYEVQYLLEALPDVADALRARLARLGDSVVIVGTGDEHEEQTWNVHVHVNDVGAAIEAGIEAGRPYRVTVVRFADTVTAGPTPVARTAVVAVAPDSGTAHLFESEGVHVVECPDSPTPAPEHVLRAIREAGATQIVLLPNATTATGVAEAAAGEARSLGLRVAVIPTRSAVQGLAAVAVHDPHRAFDDDVVAMAESAAATRFAEITIAQEESLTSVGICQAGDVLGLIDGEVVEIGRGIVSVALLLTDRLLGVGAELITVLTGEDAPPGVGDVIAQHIRERAPLTEIAVYPGGQTGRPLIIGVE